VTAAYGRPTVQADPLGPTLRAPAAASSTDELPQHATSPPRFLLATTPGGVQLHALPATGEATLGRGPECEVVLDFDSISRRHAHLRIGEPCILTDLGSRNGTRLDGEQLDRGDARPVEYGQAFSLGPVSLLLVAPSHSVATMRLTGSRLRINDIESNAAESLLSSVAQARLSVLIYGETGVGKELLAQSIHARSGRTGPFVAINCAALTDSLLESELFGHERGAFTGAVVAKPGLLFAASGGTLLLDEIGEMTPGIQAKVLRAIETQRVLPLGSVRPVPIDVRFLAATHRDLLGEIKRGTFRRDLYYRLAGISCEIPPLRERTGHIAQIALQILAAAAARGGTPPPAITPGAVAMLQAHDWPGNVRELRNVLERAMVFAAGGSIDRVHLAFDTTSEPSGKADGERKVAPEVTSMAVEDERARIVSALDACAGNQTRAARMLAISRTTLVQKVRLHGIPRPRKPR
jgi:two-component system response regulator AtoC